MSCQRVRGGQRENSRYGGRIGVIEVACLMEGEWSC